MEDVASRQNSSSRRSSSGKFDLRIDRLEPPSSAPLPSLRTCKTPRPLGAGTRREAPRYHPACRALAAPGRSSAATTAHRCHGRTRPRLLRARRRAPGSGGGSGRMFAGASPPGSHRPRLARARDPAYSFPSSPSSSDATRRDGPGHRARRPEGRPDLGRARRPGGRGPRAGRPRGRPGDRGGSASARREPRRARMAVELHRGARSRTKVFEVAGLGQEQAEMRLRATGTDSLPP